MRLEKTPNIFLFLSRYAPKTIIAGALIVTSFNLLGQNQTTANNDSDKKSSSRYGTAFTNRGVNGFVFYSDQDFLNLIGPNRDANYTMGAKLHWTGPGTNSRILGLPYLISGIDKTLFGKCFLADNNDKVTQLESFKSSFALGVSGFTPEDLASALVDTTDRPYSSTLFLKSGRVYGSADSQWMLETGLTIDILGLRVGEFVQTGIHSGQRVSDTNARPNPMGWPHQISDGFGLSASYEAMAYRSLVDFEDGHQWVTPYVGFGGSVGTYTRARGTLGLVIGKASNTQSQSIPSFFNLAIGRTENFDEPDLSIVDYGSEKIGKSEFNFFIDAQMHGNLWAYNALLQGLPWGNDPYTLKADEIEGATILWSANANLTFRTIYFRFGFSGRTKEFKKSGALPHGWGTIAFGWIL